MMGEARFPATRAAGLDRLVRFAPLAGRDYAAGRNHDHGSDGPSAVSRLSPYLRYRLIDEQEVIALSPVRRDWDARFWPHATKGFFPLKQCIPGLLQGLGLP